MFLALGDIVGHPASRGDIVRGLRVDGIGTIIGGIFNSFPTPRSPRTSAW